MNNNQKQSATNKISYKKNNLGYRQLSVTLLSWIEII